MVHHPHPCPQRKRRVLQGTFSLCLRRVEIKIHAFRADSYIHYWKLLWFFINISIWICRVAKGSFSSELGNPGHKPLLNLCFTEIDLIFWDCLTIHSLIDFNAIKSATVRWKAGSRDIQRKTLPSPKVSSWNIGGKNNSYYQDCGKDLQNHKATYIVRLRMHKAFFKARIPINAGEDFKNKSYTPQLAATQTLWPCRTRKGSRTFPGLCSRFVLAWKEHPVSLATTPRHGQHCSLQQHPPSISPHKGGGVPQSSARFSFSWK